MEKIGVEFKIGQAADAKILPAARTNVACVTMVNKVRSRKTGLESSVNEGGRFVFTLRRIGNRLHPVRQRIVALVKASVSRRSDNELTGVSSGDRLACNNSALPIRSMPCQSIAWSVSNRFLQAPL